MAEVKPQDDRIASLEAQIANLQKLLAAQQPVLQPIQAEQEREAEYQKKAEWLGKSCQERTQEIANERFGKDCRTRYRVRIVDGRKGTDLVPAVLIPARSKEEAKGRYDSLCGILGVDSVHRYEIEAVNAA